MLHLPKIFTSVDHETRPVNVAVYWIIKLR
jgi:hypothetical protein